MNPSMRLSDVERTNAINDLARAVGEGRLSMEEFENRSDDIMRAVTLGDLAPIFADIPSRAPNEVKIYSRGEVERARQASKKPRLATSLVGTLGLTFASIVAFSAESAPLLLVGVGCLFLIPALWILMYVAKIGPESWHQPSPRAIEREQRREMKALERAQWAERRRQAGEITGDAMNLARRKLNQWNTAGK